MGKEQSKKQEKGNIVYVTGKVYLYMPNVHDTYTAEKTIWHEVVGHKGLRGLFGNDFNKFMRSLWYFHPSTRRLGHLGNIFLEKVVILFF